MKNYIPTVEAQMLIRRPAMDVYQAFVDPTITTQFWFTHSSGKLEVGKMVQWNWEMYGASANVVTLQLVPGELIVTEWGEPPTTVEYHFKKISENETYVVIKNYGFTETGNDLIEVIKDNTGGFTTVLDGLKAWLEHGIQLQLIGDKFLRDQ